VTVNAGVSSGWTLEKLIIGMVSWTKPFICIVSFSTHVNICFSVPDFGRWHVK
jgi:hypothetical protein